MELTLSQLGRDETAFVAGYKPGNQAYRSKLLSLGLTKGVAVRMKKTAPLGDPVEIEVRGYSLSLRKAEADILVLRRGA